MQNKDVLYAQNWFEQFSSNVESGSVSRNNVYCYSVPDLLSRYDSLYGIIHWAFAWATTPQGLYGCVWERREGYLRRNARLTR